MKKIIQKIKTAKSIGLFVHTKPDPDAIGSVFALYFALKQKNKKVDIILEEKLPSNLQFFEIENIIYKLEKTKYDLLVALDCGSKKLLSKYTNAFSSFENTVAIDHHRTREAVAKLEFVDAEASSTAEILFCLLNALKTKIDKQIATCLYAGLVGDTGRFLHDNTTAKVFDIASNLLKFGSDINLVNTKLFRSDSTQKVKLLKAMLNNLEIKNRIAISCLSLEDYKKADCSVSQGYESINTLQTMEEVDIAIVLSEIKPNITNASFRSKQGFNVSVIAQNFGGGGHTQASGFKEVAGNLKDIKTQILDFIKKHKKEIKIGWRWFDCFE